MLTKMAKRQQTLLTIWTKGDKKDSVKRRREDSDTVEVLGLVQGPGDDLPVDSVCKVSEDDETEIPRDDGSCEETDGEGADLDEMEEIDDAPYEETGDSQINSDSSSCVCLSVYSKMLC